MSFDALAWAGKCRCGSAARKLVLMALADRHNTEEQIARPSVAWITEWTDLNRKTVISALHELERMGLISDSGERSGATAQIKCYRLNLETVPKTVQSQKRNSSTFSAKGSQKRDTDTVKEPVRSEAKASSPRIWPLPSGVSLQVWTDFLKSPKRRKAGMSETAYAGIVRNLRICAEHGFPPGEVLALAVERGWITVKLEWVQNDRRTNSLGRHQPADGLSATARAAIAVFGR